MRKESRSRTVASIALTSERLGVQPEEIVFLDDAEANVAAAAAYGMHAILFTDTTQAIADIQSCLQGYAT